jgi:hypothetical protein
MRTPQKESSATKDAPLPRSRFDMRAVSISPLLLFVVVCACGVSQAAKSILDADDHLVADCKFLGNVHGSSGWGGFAQGAGIENAKNGAREDAAKLGATHVVWVSESGGFMPTGSARAYQCAPSARVAVASPGPAVPGSASIQVAPPGPVAP